jgi:RimJ/RimL family protein N-acetyltransferase
MPRSDIVTPVVPGVIRTPRLLLRPWAAADAQSLRPVLERNRSHLEPWIPVHVASLVSLEALAGRLSRFADDFTAGRGFRYALFAVSDSRLLGEADMFPRNASGRVPLAQADRVELGYWLDRDETGRGFATEAAGALLDVAKTLASITQVEIRCETGNEPSRRVPPRLGFTLAATVDDVSVTTEAAPVKLEVWTFVIRRKAV